MQSDISPYLTLPLRSEEEVREIRRQARRDLLSFFQSLESTCEGQKERETEEGT